MTLLSHYWRDDDPVELTGAIARDWADILEGLPQQAIHQACLRHLREEPRRKPTPGMIYSMAREAMPKPQVVRQAEEPRDPRVTPEQAAAIMEQAGFAPRRFGDAAE